MKTESDVTDEEGLRALMDITTKSHNVQRGRLGKPPQLKNLSRIDHMECSPVKNEYEISEKITTLPTHKSKHYFEAT